MKQEFALRRGGVHLFGQGSERDPAFFEAVHHAQQMRQRPAEAIQLPYDQAVATSGKRQRLRQPGAIVAAAARMVLEEVPFIDAGGQECIATFSICLLMLQKWAAR